MRRASTYVIPCTEVLGDGSKVIKSIFLVTGRWGEEVTNSRVRTRERKRRVEKRRPKMGE
jgi:hypothetical protein